MGRVPKEIEIFLRDRVSMCDVFEIPSCSFGSRCLKDSIKESFQDISDYYDRKGYNINLDLYDFLVKPLNSTFNFHPNSQCKEFSLILGPRALVASYSLNENKIMIRDESDFTYVDSKAGKLYRGLSVENSRFFR